MPPLIWLIEDESGIADTIIYALETDGFSVRWFERGLPALEQLDHESPALILLDIGLPDCNGFDLCRQILARGDFPLVFLTARSEEIDRIVGLELGADDYIAKPFSPREVCARVRSILRRSNRQQAMVSADSGENNEHGDKSRNHSDNQDSLFQIDEAGASIRYCGQLLLLTRYEYLLLKTLLTQPGRVFSRAQLMDKVWQDAEETLERTVDTHIKTLRAKLRAIHAEIDPILTHRGLGYSLDVVPLKNNH